MGLTRKHGISAFQKRTPQQLPVVASNIPKIHADYGEFCSRINHNSADEWRNRGIEDFRRLCAVPGIVEIGVNLEYSRLHLLTECIHMRDDRGTWRTIGELIVTYFAVTKTLKFENVGRTQTREDQRLCAHPHVIDGTICFSAREELMRLLLDARISTAMHRLMPCLRMDADVVDVQMAYLGLEHWPKREGD